LHNNNKTVNTRLTCRYFGLARSTFYRYDKHGESGLAKKSTAAKHHPRKVPPKIAANIQLLHNEQGLQMRLTWI